MRVASQTEARGAASNLLAMMLKIVLALLVALAIGRMSTPASAAAVDDPSIVAFLGQSASRWNHGDLDGFMRGYENSPATVYVNANGEIRGYAAIRAHYAAHYGKAGMGVLSFSDLSVRPLGTGYAVILAHWHLAMAGGKHPTGPFLLVLHRSRTGWHIIEDCTP